MNKTEENLIKAIESNDFDKAVKALGKFQDLKNSTDVECNKYYKQIEAIADNAPEEEVVEEVKAEKVEEKTIEVKVEEVELQKAGRKKEATIGKQKVIDAFTKFMVIVNDFKIQTAKDRSKDGRFALRLYKQQLLIRKRLFR